MFDLQESLLKTENSNNQRAKRNQNQSLSKLSAKKQGGICF